PVCSPMLMVFQYHAGPLSSNFEMTLIVTPGDDAKIGGSPITGVSGPSGCVRSTTLMEPLARASASCVSRVICHPEQRLLSKSCKELRQSLNRRGSQRESQRAQRT